MEANVIVVKTKRSYIVYIGIKRGNLRYRDFVGVYCSWRRTIQIFSKNAATLTLL